MLQTKIMRYAYKKSKFKINKGIQVSYSVTEEIDNLYVYILNDTDHD